MQSVYRKVHLPNYGVFDEQRYFTAGHAGATIDVGGRRVGVTVCEDLWLPGAPASEEAAAGAQLIVNISASPYHAGKGAERELLFAERAREHGVHIAFCGLVGGQDELLFDGHSFVLDPTGSRSRALRSSRRSCCCVTVDLETSDRAARRGTPRCIPRSPPWRPRSTPRCASACTTTWRRTAFATSSLDYPVGSTPRSLPASPPTRSAPSG